MRHGSTAASGAARHGFGRSRTQNYRFRLNIGRDPRYKESVTVTASNPVIDPPATGCVHVWRVPLALDLDLDTSCLSAAERERQLLRRGEAAHRFALSHVALRRISAAYEGCAAAAARLTTVYGERPRAAHGLELSLAHCDDLALIAATRAPVGVDVESLAAADADPDDLADLAEATLTRSEIELLERTAPIRRSLLWLRLWVRKEAVLKSRGASLGEIPLFELDVRASRLGELALADLSPDGQHVAAIALAADGIRVDWKELDDVP
jgi:phosphopantetheinyl transferase